jgi:hypothetical protein
MHDEMGYEMVALRRPEKQGWVVGAGELLDQVLSQPVAVCI